MNKLLYYNVVLLVGFFLYSISDSTKEAILPEDELLYIDVCQTENVSFQAGEELVYTIYYNWNFVWLTAGEARFKVEDAGNEYHLSMINRSYKSYEWFYKFTDHYNTYIDKQTLLPRLSTKSMQHSSFQLYDKTVLDQQERKVTTWRGKTKEDLKEKVFEAEDCLHDMISLMYYARNVDFNDFEEGQSFPIELFMDNTFYPLEMKFLGKEKEKKVRGVGKFNAMMFSPEVAEGKIFKEDKQMKVWVTDDNNKIPLLIESPVTVGSIKVVLKSYEGLRYDLEAKI